MESMCTTLCQLYHTFLNFKMDGTCDEIFRSPNIAIFLFLTWFHVALLFSKVEMHMCTDRYKDKKLKAIWEPMVIAKIIVPSE